jgi:hypothetical protein
MQPVARTEIVTNAEFVARRPRLEAELMRHKQHRYVQLGAELLLAFEDRHTVRWQVQEMCRVEGITAEDAIAHELTTYNALLPGPNELSATLMIGYPDPAERDRRLRELVGLQDHLWLQLGHRRVQARFDADQYSTDRISSVQFVRFALDATARAAFLDLAQPAQLLATHPALAAEAVLSPAVRGALAEDLTA